MDTTQTSTGDSTTPTFMETIHGLMRGEVSEATMGLVFKGAIALLMIIVAYFAAKLVSRWVSAIMCKRVDETLGKFAGKFTFYTIFLMAGLAVLQTAGMELTSFAAILAAAGFAIGLSFQGTLSNFAAGILLLVFRPFKVGDVVNAAGVMGKIQEIDMFTTIFDTPDNRRLIVPNSSISGAIIENISFHKERRVDVTVGVCYAASLDDTRAVLVASAEALADKLISGPGRGYQIILSNLGASSVDWTIRFWTASENFFAVKEALTSEVKRQLDASGIEIPFPQMQLHIADQASASSPKHPSLPIPKMNTVVAARGNRIRPRARGENL
ncbi:MAG: mechanosensitive ion channel family protein [Pirellulaceae bacterium]